jgi:phosphoglucosamine mutase
VLPTPAVAVLGATDADLGVMLSASHNPMPDNGVKFFARGGTSWRRRRGRDRARLGEPWDRPTAPRRPGPAARGRGETYVSDLLGTLPNRLDGLRVVVDCAHGAASDVAPGRCAVRAPR